MSEEVERIGPEPPQVPEKVRADALARASTAWEARVRGGTWAQAAETAGYANAPNAMRAVRSVFGSLPPIEKDEARRLWRDRLELLFGLGLVDAEEQRPGAVTALVRVAEAASRLDGLAEPQRLSITPTDAELERWVRDVLEAKGVLSFAEEGDIFADTVDAVVIEDEETSGP